MTWMEGRQHIQAQVVAGESTEVADVEGGGGRR